MNTARTRRAGFAWIAIGFLVAALSQVASPQPQPPLYDGVLPIEVYRWLEPPPGAHGDPEGASAVIPVEGGVSPLIAVATPEIVPQAQIFAVPTSLDLPPGVTQIRVAITPVHSSAGAPSGGHLVSNVYRFDVTDQRGMALTAPLSAEVTIVMRSADETLAAATMLHLVNGSWLIAGTSDVGEGATFFAVASDFGEFALLAPGSEPTGVPDGTPASPTAPALSPGEPTTSESARTPGPTTAPTAPAGSDLTGNPLLIVAIGLGIATVVSLVIWVMRRRREPWDDGPRPGWR